MTLPDYIDNCKIISEISSGGYAVVYKAWDAILEKYYAIKLMREDAYENADRFLTEAKVLAQLNHPNIPNIISYGTYENRPFLKMDFVDGNDLNQIIHEKGKIPLQVTCAIILQVARALKYAHNHEYEIYGEKRHGIIHRDIKPQNIMINKDGQVKLIDFGLVKIANLSKHSLEYVSIGTPQYMSPEQHIATNEVPVDKQSDIYSLGCVLYECLTGRCQFDAESITSVIGQKEKEEYDYSLLKGSSGNIRKLVKKATSPEKEKRFKNADELIKRIEKELSREEAQKPDEVVRRYFTGDTIETTRKKNSYILPIIILLFGVGMYVLFFWIKTDESDHTSNSTIEVDTVENDIKSQQNTEKKNEDNVVSNKDTVRNNQLQPQKNKTQKNKTVVIKSEKEVEPSPVGEEISSSVLMNKFQSGSFEEIVTAVEAKNISEINDSIYLIYCGALLETNVGKLGELIFKRNINDGFLEYIRGRYLLNLNKNETANERLLKSLTKKSIMSFDEQLYYYLVVCSFNIYSQKPNISNKDYYYGRRNEYIKRYCDNKTGEYCKTVKEKYKI